MTRSLSDQSNAAADLRAQLAASIEATAPAKSYKLGRVCQECGAARADTAKGKFCSSSCRADFNNRRKARGAELYDLFMEHRFNRTDPNSKGLWSMMCSRASVMRDADKLSRGGRKSWDPKAIERLPLAHANMAGDRR